MNRKGLGVAVVLVVAAAAVAAGWRLAAVHGSPAPAISSPQGWNSAAAASYLDAREREWQQWPAAQRDHGTVCISCHTQAPYAMVRSTLQRQLGEPAMPAPEKAMLQSVEYRVNHWAEITPFYTDALNGAGKTAESHATEAVLNAVMLTSYDAQQGQLRPVTRTALQEAWALQQPTGALAGGWQWQNFRLAPWESKESGYQGAAQLLIAVESAPGGYAQEPALRANLEALRCYLRRGYAAQPVVNQLYVLWAAAAAQPGLSSARPPIPDLLTPASHTPAPLSPAPHAAGSYTPAPYTPASFSPDPHTPDPHTPDTHTEELLTSDQRRSLLGKLQKLQRDDGGWGLSALGDRSWFDELRRPDTSDGYATGLAVLVLEESGADAHDATLRHGLSWLNSHQQKAGNWTATSLNEERDPQSNVGKFMSDAATGYAVLALEKAGARPPQ